MQNSKMKCIVESVLCIVYLLTFRHNMQYTEKGKIYQIEEVEKRRECKWKGQDNLFLQSLRVV